MYGALIRAAPQLLIFPLIAAALAKTLDPMVQFMLDGTATQNDMLIKLLNGASNHFVLVGVLGLLLGLVARAIAEAQTPGRGI